VTSHAPGGRCCTCSRHNAKFHPIRSTGGRSCICPGQTLRVHSTGGSTFLRKITTTCKFHPDPIWNHKALCFLKHVATTTGGWRWWWWWVAIWDQFLIQSRNKILNQPIKFKIHKTNSGFAADSIPCKRSTLWRPVSVPCTGIRQSVYPADRKVHEGRFHDVCRSPSDSGCRPEVGLGGRGTPDCSMEYRQCPHYPLGKCLSFPYRLRTNWRRRPSATLSRRIQNVSVLISLFAEQPNLPLKLAALRKTVLKWYTF